MSKKNSKKNIEIYEYKHEEIKNTLAEVKLNSEEIQQALKWSNEVGPLIQEIYNDIDESGINSTHPEKIAVEISKGKKYLRFIEESKKKLTKPFRDATTAINNFFKDIETEIDLPSIETDYNTISRNWSHRKMQLDREAELKAREEELRIKRQAEEEAKKALEIAAKFEEHGDEEQAQEIIRQAEEQLDDADKYRVPAFIAEDTSRTIKNESGTTSQKWDCDIEIKNESKFKEAIMTGKIPAHLFKIVLQKNNAKPWGREMLVEKNEEIINIYGLTLTKKYGTISR